MFWGINWEFDSIFVSAEIKSLIENENMKGIRFSNVHRSKDRIVEGAYQLQIEQTLQKGFSNYNTKTITCKQNNEEDFNKDKSVLYCGRVKYHHPRIGGYLFDKSIFDRQFNLVKSFEYFGSGGSTNRLIICSRKFKEFYIKNKLKGLSFAPIQKEEFKGKPAYNNK